MSRPGWVEVYHRAVWALGGWTWRYRHPNGREISRCGRAYPRLRDLTHSLEGAFPGFRLLDQSGGLEGPGWFLHGYQPAHPPTWLPADDKLTLGMAMRGHLIPVSVPDGISLASRR